MSGRIISRRVVFRELASRLCEIHGEPIRIEPEDLQLQLKIAEWLNERLAGLSEDFSIDGNCRIDPVTGHSADVMYGLYTLTEGGTPSRLQTPKSYLYKIDVGPLKPEEQRVPFMTAERVSELYAKIKEYFKAPITF